MRKTSNIVGWVFDPPQRHKPYRVGIPAHRNGRKSFRLPENIYFSIRYRNNQ
ncbi:MAG: hypothetical protein IKI11_07975 [Neisseriaceae bacterium]|nr:hypothetical protein [Neisseriaceae bacterium]